MTPAYGLWKRREIVEAVREKQITNFVERTLGMLKRQDVPSLFDFERTCCRGTKRWLAEMVSYEIQIGEIDIAIIVDVSATESAKNIAYEIEIP